jgi:hypothetical protein
MNTRLPSDLRLRSYGRTLLRVADAIVRHDRCSLAAPTGVASAKEMKMKTKTTVKAGIRVQNSNETLVKDPAALKVKTRVRCGATPYKYR